ncbi:hypothetical protein GQ55_5G351900 [Panicum hallii var. hallii]|uniref:Uncharacterized protein n=1 Tax=Panicum hallii var. hallii TaxID=1504633 RepID=A0A2T7DMB4_9POAL|nr:hypothetical protein GQ55_5G351900 [Panicum hallii var. hallii]
MQACSGGNSPPRCFLPSTAWSLGWPLPLPRGAPSRSRSPRRSSKRGVAGWRPSTLALSPAPTPRGRHPSSPPAPPSASCAVPAHGGSGDGGGRRARGGSRGVPNPLDKARAAALLPCHAPPLLIHSHRRPMCLGTRRASNNLDRVASFHREKRSAQAILRFGDGHGLPPHLHLDRRREEGGGAGAEPRRRRAHPLRPRHPPRAPLHQRPHLRLLLRPPLRRPRRRPAPALALHPLPSLQPPRRLRPRGRFPLDPPHPRQHQQPIRPPLRPPRQHPRRAQPPHR